MALAPAESIDATAIVVTLLVAAGLLGAATVLFGRRLIRPPDRWSVSLTYGRATAGTSASW